MIALSYQIDWNIRWIVLAVRKSITMCGDELLGKEQNIREQSTETWWLIKQEPSASPARKTTRLGLWFPIRVVEALNKLQSYDSSPENWLPAI